jgi:hypothetical protein
MAHPHHLHRVIRVFIACSPDYRNRRALLEAMGSIFLDTIEEQREYYYSECVAIAEIFDDGMFNRDAFRLIAYDDPAQRQTLKSLQFTHVIADGDAAFVENLLSEVGGDGTVLVRLA